MGVWLLEFLVVSFEKYQIVKKISNSKKIKAYDYSNKENLVANNSVDASVLMNSNEWNNNLFCYFLSKLKKNIRIEKLKVSKRKTKNQNYSKNFSFKLFILNIANYISSFFRVKNEIFIIGSYLSFIDEILLQIKINKFFIFNLPKNFVSKSKHDDLRSDYYNNRLSKTFEKLTLPLVKEFIPKSFLEDFENIIRFSKKLPWEQNPKKYLPR